MGHQLSKLNVKPRNNLSVFEVLRKQTKDFARVWLFICDQENTYKTAKPLDASLYSSHWLFKNETDIEFYETRWVQSPIKHSPKLDRALKTDNTCLDSVYVMFHRVCQRLLAHPSVKAIEWISVDPRPRLVLIEHEIAHTNEEFLREHDCIRITASDDSQYVLDLSGWQFGYNNYIFTWEEYERDCVAPRSTIRVRNPVAENVEVAEKYSEYPERLERLQKWKGEVTQASDAALKKLARGIELSL